ncbi:hypothetical protein F400_gp124 [Bacillus phage BCD7]|uniref:Uncharacterized protein n=1 Tax=Bacillus phage BCD7 TaxID=1136534 RepID=J9PUM8_9CAUD|nr:hypothetical protein F400_gp124 [Bacillus phage BCD7]AEZ50571.1 hypothetical protein BCD7_0124 [Bacillus phage BCD7]
MYLLEARARQFGDARGITAQVQARHLGVERDEFIMWLEDPKTIPMDYEAKLCSYFKMQPHELKQEVMVHVPLSKLEKVMSLLEQVTPESIQCGKTQDRAISIIEKFIEDKEKQLFGKG